MMRSMLKQAVVSQHLKFSYVLADSWFSSSDNLLYIHKPGKYLGSAVKPTSHPTAIPCQQRTSYQQILLPGENNRQATQCC
jgi:hypothetical protein